MLIISSLFCFVGVIVGILLMVPVFALLASSSGNMLSHRRVCGFDYEAYQNDVLNGIDGATRIKRRESGWYDIC